ncbi:MAG: leucine-rich repeat protein [Prevotella sp.]|nr:leucine-rich repeat protein [Prevotella sp.]
MKKCLLILVAGIFSVLTANAWQVTFSSDGKTAYIVGSGSDGQNLGDLGVSEAAIKAAETLIFTGTINTLDPFQGGGFTNATTVDYSGATFVETNDGDPKEYQAWNPDTKSYYTATVQKTKNCMTFKYFPNCSTAKLASVKTLCQSCFDNNFAMTTTFTIPSSVEYIAGHAVDDTPIHEITIPKTVKYIENQAFQNAEIDNLIEVTVEGYTTAEHGAFDKDVTVGQTQADGTRIYATLHFPAGSEEFFTNTQHQLDLETSLHAGKFQAWLDNHYTVSNNGWQDFISSSPGKGIPVDKPVVLRTFSDNVAHYVPLCYRAYIVNGVTKNSDGSYTLKLQEIFGIPANTGVIIYGEADSGSFALPILSGASWQTNPYDRTVRSTVVDNKTINLQNYLVANCTLETGTKIGPYELGSDGTVVERNFVMGPYSKTDMSATSPISNDYVAFFRAKKLTPGKNKAHLKLPNSIYEEPKGAELLTINPSEFREDEWPRDFAEYGDWGEKPRTLPAFFSKSFGEPNEEATGISNVTVENTEDGVIYTLQGVKVENPSKGVYIQNGKKFIVK